jgi:Na+/H+ antiporter NhaC
MNFETMSKQRKMILIAAAIGIVSMFLPWVSVFGFSVNGMNGWGVLVFFVFCSSRRGFFYGRSDKKS